MHDLVNRKLIPPRLCAEHSPCSLLSLRVSGHSRS